MIEIRGTLAREMKKQFEKNIPDSNLDRKVKMSDAEAIAQYQKKRRKILKLDEELEARDLNRADEEQRGLAEIARMEARLSQLVEGVEDEKIRRLKEEINALKAKTNHLARQYGLVEPNNPEALAHDRLHCQVCDTSLHWKDAYKNAPEEIQLLFGRDEEVRHLCCYCFAKMEREEIVKIQTGKDPTKEIRMMIYNPEDFVIESKGRVIEEKIQKEIEKTEKLSKIRKIAIESKIKQYKGVVSLIGKFKFDSLSGEDTMVKENWLNNFPTRYNYANM